MTIEEFKTLPLEKKLLELKHSAELLGSYDRYNENGGSKTTGDIYALYDFWVFLSEDEKMVIPSRRNPLPPVVTEEEA
ncbi:MAG: hypothetical protein AMXMBFR79_15550 [Chitinophagaceae bacterium]|nr:hypothetical protein [Chitinophagaceae bacterium]MCZ2298768.1 hypothetical protein [Chitinophagales bacterium]